MASGVSIPLFLLAEPILELDNSVLTTHQWFWSTTYVRCGTGYHYHGYPLLCPYLLEPCYGIDWAPDLLAHHYGKLLETVFRQHSLTGIQGIGIGGDYPLSSVITSE